MLRKSFQKEQDPAKEKNGLSAAGFLGGEFNLPKLEERF